VLRQPPHLLLSRAAAQRPRSRLAIIAVALIHLLAIYALASGLAFHAVRNLSHAITVDLVKPQQQVPPPAPAIPQLAVPVVPRIPVPEIRIRRSAAPSIHVLASPVATPPAPPVATPLPQPVQWTPAKGIVSTHTAPPYPALARRLGLSGDVVLGFEIETDGTVAKVAVVKSSGNAGLDEAAASWVAKTWRYRPATRNGEPYPTHNEAQVDFNLKKDAY
jgi:protein TonB